MRGKSCQKPNSGVVLQSCFMFQKLKDKQSWRMCTRELRSREENSVEVSRRQTASCVPESGTASD